MSNPFSDRRSASLPSTNTTAATGQDELSNNVLDPLAYLPIEDSKDFKDGGDHIKVEPFLYRDKVDMQPDATVTTGTQSEDKPPNLSTQEQKRMMESIMEIFHLEEEEIEDQEMRDEGDEGEVVVDLQDQQRRTERLIAALDMLGKLWWARSEHLEAVTEKLADGSRDPKWRIPIGDSGILNFYLDILNTQVLEHALKIQVLRLVGNSCADTDENRARLVDSNYLLPVIMQLADTSLLPFAIPVLYNICVDYEPAQKQASQSFLTKELIDLISSPRFSESLSFIGYVCKLLDMMVEQETDQDLAPENTALVLLQTAADKENPTDMEDFIALVISATYYLKFEKFQRALITPGGLETTLDVLVQSYSRFDSQPGFPSQLDQDDAKLLSQMRSNLNQVLSDVSALPEFKQAVPIQSQLTVTLRRWLSSPQMQLQICACIILGNLARSDATCEEMVHIVQIHHPLIAIITEANDSQLLHAALGFLKNLALPVSNKKLLGEANIFDALPRLWALDTLQQIQFSAISLARQLITNTFGNVRRIGRPLTQDMASPASSKTKVSFLIDLFDRTDVDPIKMEISRLITAICRVYNSISDPSLEGLTADHLTSMRQYFFNRHPDIGRPLAFMVSQTKWPVVRSEGWFVFALMARYPEGADCISEVMHDINVFQVLVELMTGKNIIEYNASPTTSQATSPSTSGSAPTPSSSITQQITETLNPPTTQQPQPHAQAPEMQRIDRMNALVLLSELLKNRGDRMAVMRRALFEDLLKGGGEIVLAYNEVNPEGGEGGDMVKGSIVPIEKMTKGVKLQDLATQVFSDVM